MVSQDQTTRKLTPKQQRFVEEYLVDLNAKRSAIRAGYSEHTAEQQGYQLLQNPSVESEIQRLMEERSKRTDVDADYVIQHLKHIVESAKSDSACVSALGLLGKHLGLYTDKIETTETGPATKIIVLPPEGFEDCRCGCREKAEQVALHGDSKGDTRSF